jgi:hypothetical protein
MYLETIDLTRGKVTELLVGSKAVVNLVKSLAHASYFCMIEFDYFCLVNVEAKTICLELLLSIGII